MTIKFDGELFGDSMFLTLCTRIMSVMFALAASLFTSSSPVHRPPYSCYATVSLANVVATYTQIEALKYVSFVVATLAKSCKMLPVLVWSMLLYGHHPSGSEWGFAVVVTASVTDFVLSGEVTSPVNDDGQTGYGFLLLLLFLMSDGLVSPLQEYIFDTYHSSRVEMILHVNVLSALIALVIVLVDGDLFSAFAFGFKHSLFFWEVLTLSLASALSQWCIYSQIRDYGALTFAATGNARQVISILISCASFDHHLSFSQGLALVVLFGAILLRTTSLYVTEQKEKLDIPDEEAARPDNLKPANESKQTTLKASSSDKIVNVP